MKTLNYIPVAAAVIAALITLPAWSAEHSMQSEGGDDMTSSQPAPQAQPESTPPMGAQEQATREVTTDNPLMSLHPRDLEGQEVVGSNGEEIGRISEVVSDRDEGRIYAVISSGGFLGLIGGTEHAVALDDLTIVEGKIHLDTTQENLSATEEYQEENYLVVEPRDQPISEFSAFERKPE